MTRDDANRSPPATAPETLNPAAFAGLFGRSFRSSWVIAVGIVGDRPMDEAVDRYPDGSLDGERLAAMETRIARDEATPSWVCSISRIEAIRSGLLASFPLSLLDILGAPGKPRLPVNVLRATRADKFARAPALVMVADPSWKRQRPSVGRLRCLGAGSIFLVHPQATRPERH